MIEENENENLSELISVTPSSSQSTGISSRPPDNRQVSIVLHRLTTDEINSIVRLSNDDSPESEISSQQSQQSSITNPSQEELLSFSRYEFLEVLRDNSYVLFVHDIEQLYYFRYTKQSSKIYACRQTKRMSCKATVIIDPDGKCKQYGSASHCHPSVKVEYFNILLMQEMKRECIQDDVLRVERMRSVYDRHTLM